MIAFFAPDETAPMFGMFVGLLCVLYVIYVI